MAYSFKNTRRTELRYFSKEYQKHPSKNLMYKEVMRLFEGIPEAMHTQGNLVKYNGKTARIVHVSNQGVYLQYIENTQEGIFGKNPRPFFVKEEQYRKKAFPYYVVETI